MMQHLKVKPKFAYAFMAAIRMVPIMIASFIQLRHSLKMRYQVIDAQHYRGLKRLKHLFIRCSVRTFAVHTNFLSRWRRKASKMVHVRTTTKHHFHIKISCLSS